MAFECDEIGFLDLQFRAARKAAEEIGAQMVLGDRPIEITVCTLAQFIISTISLLISPCFAQECQSRMGSTFCFCFFG